MAKKIREKLIPQEIKNIDVAFVPGKVTDLGDDNAIGESATIEELKTIEGDRYFHKGFKLTISKTSEEDVYKIIIFDKDADSNYIELYNIPSIIIKSIEDAEYIKRKLFVFTDVMISYIKKIKEIAELRKYESTETGDYNVDPLIYSNDKYPYDVMNKFDINDFSVLSKLISSHSCQFKKLENDLYRAYYLELGNVLHNMTLSSYVQIVIPLNDYGSPIFNIVYYENENQIKTNLKVMESNILDMIYTTGEYDKEVKEVKYDISKYLHVKYFDFIKKMAKIQNDILKTNDISVKYFERYVKVYYGDIEDIYDCDDDVNILELKLHFFDKYKLAVYDFLKFTSEFSLYLNLSSKLREMDPFLHSKKDFNNEVNKITFMLETTDDITHNIYRDEFDATKDSSQRVSILDNYAINSRVDIILSSTNIVSKSYGIKGTFIDDELILKLKFLYMLDSYSPISSEYLEIMQECPFSLSDIAYMVHDFRKKGLFLKGRFVK